MTPRIAHFTASDGIRHQACTLWGDESKPAVLCVHGLTRNGRDFDYLARELAADYFVVCPDVAGRGMSDPLADPLAYQYPTYLADIMALVAQLKLTRLHWVGTSMGGILGMMAAGAAPGLMRSLLLNDIGCVIPASGLLRIREITNFPTRFASRAEGEGVFRQRCAGFGIEEDEHWQHLFTHGLLPDGEGWRFAYDPMLFKHPAFSLEAPLEDVVLWGLWPAVQLMPVMLVRGANSDLLTEETAAQMQAQHSQLVRKDWPGVGHAPALMAHKQIAPIREWMSAI